jgi:chromosome partitioning protein
MILLVGGEKGGVGKTTLATHLAVLRKRAGRSVVLLDTDAQGTASQWADFRKELGDEVVQFPCLSARGTKVNVELKELVRHYQDVVVDCGGADSPEFRSGLLAADMLLLPLRPGSFDFWTLAKLGEVLDMVEGLNPGLHSAVALTQVPATAYERARREISAIMAELPRFRLLQIMIVFRAAFGHAATSGRIVTEIERRDPKACSEVSLLHDELFGRAGEEA